MGTFTFCNNWQRDQDPKWILITYHYLLEKDQEHEIWYLYHHFEQFYANPTKLLIKYACCKGQDSSENKSSKLHGFSNTYKLESKINSALNDLKKMK